MKSSWMLPALAVVVAAGLAARAEENAEGGPVRGRLAERVTIGGDIRVRSEGQWNYDFRSDRNADLTFVGLRIRLDLDFAVAEDVTVHLRGQDARRFGEFGPVDASGSTFLKEAWWQWRDALGRPIDVKVGRQEIVLADERLVGAFGWSNTGRSFDAVRLDARPWENLSVMLFGATTFTGDTAGGVRTDHDQRFFGVAGTTRLAERIDLDLWFLGLHDRRGLGAGGGDQKIYTYGGRVRFPVGARLTFDLQANGQFGDNGVNDISAWAAHARGTWKTGWTLIDRVYGEYNQASGDPNPNDRKTETFNQLFPTNHDKYGYADLQGWRNMRNGMVGLGGTVGEAWSWHANYHWFRRDEVADDFYTAGGAGRGFAGTGGDHMGTEVDAVVRWKPHRRIAFELGYSHFFLDDDLEAIVRAQGGAPEDADFAYLQSFVAF